MSEVCSLHQHFGVCPDCHGEYPAQVLNVGQEHWFACARCETKWCVGSNLFDSWREDELEDWVEALAFMSGFRQVEPLTPADDFVCATCEKAEALRRAGVSPDDAYELLDGPPF